MKYLSLSEKEQKDIAKQKLKMAETEHYHLTIHKTVLEQSIDTNSAPELIAVNSKLEALEKAIPLLNNLCGE